MEKLLADGQNFSSREASRQCRGRISWHAMTHDDDVAEGDLHGRAMPVLDNDDVDALARAVQPILDEDDAIRAWCTRANVERFLRADRGNLAKATKRLTDTLKWRIAERPETKVCAACIDKDLRSHYMNFVGWDRKGRALVFSDIGLAVDKSPSTNAAHCTQVLELLEPNLRPFPNDQYVWVVDFHQFSVYDMNPSVASACLGLFAKCYPERLAGMIMVGAPMLFNGLYRAVCAFADPVTVKKVRFVVGPDGKGGGKAFDVVMDEFFDAETKGWLSTEMMENRRRWKDVAKRKSWMAATFAGRGSTHGWWQGVQESGSKAAGAPEPPVEGEAGHDIRGCDSFVRCDAFKNVADAVRRRGANGKLTAQLVDLAPGDEGAVPEE